MNRMKFVIISACVILGIFAVIVNIVSVSNTEIGLRAQVVAQQQANEAVFDNTWKIINQVAQVPEQYKSDFKEVYGEIMSERYQGERGGALMSWIHEHNPTFDSSLYANVQTAIEAQRNNFTREQKRLIDLHREHKIFISKFPNSIIVGNRGEVEIVVVTSERTEEAFGTGQDNDVEVF